MSKKEMAILVVGLALGSWIMAFWSRAIVMQEFSQTGVSMGETEAAQTKYIEIRNELLDDQIGIFMLCILLTLVAGGTIITSKLSK